MFPLLSTQLTRSKNNKISVATDNKISNHDIYLNDMMLCKIEEANECFCYLHFMFQIVSNRNPTSFLPVSEIAQDLGQLTSIGLTFFHTIRRCDTTSSISGKEKTSLWDTEITVFSIWKWEDELLIPCIEYNGQLIHSDLNHLH